MKKLLFIFLIITSVTNTRAQSITYFKDIAPIIQTKCAPCHHPGGGAPFSLLSYDDVAKRSSFIREVVETRYMPPWKADNKYVHFANDRSLSQKDITTIIKWIDSKTPKGTETKPVQQPNIVEGTTYGRQPDLVLKMKDSFLVKGDNGERFVIFKIPFELQDSANIEAIEFTSNNKKLVHHANYEIHDVADTTINLYNTVAYINLTEDDRKKYDQYKPYRKTITYYGGWIPGSTYEYYPKDFGWVLPKRGVILLTVHFAPTPVDEQSISGVNLFFKKTPVTRAVKVISFGSGGIGEKDITPSPFYIKPNEVKTFTLDLTNPGEDFSVMYVWPHMHYIGKEYKAYAIKPNGDTIKLVHIANWDFRWQEIYRFKNLVRVPKGSVIHIEGTYDNTASNPANPHSPPQTVWSFGDMQSTNEMMTLIMVFLPYKPGDESISLQ